ncbi:MAG: hypothetical protein HY512_01200 [Candidatus Aenigmarchaeota archaeon]|nr:hypothetical protein [Candidatus Aenigmarchaeota archaeon]
MIKPFEYFIKENLVRKEIPNRSLAKSLVEKAEVRIYRILKSEIEEKEASIVFEDIYEILRESAQAIMELKGYKPYSHEALISFLWEGKYFSESVIIILDNYRTLRNKSVYRAEGV